MQHFFGILRKRLASKPQTPVFQAERLRDVQIMVPESVVLPLPRTSRDEISVPASINGRDLSTGRL